MQKAVHRLISKEIKNKAELQNLYQSPYRYVIRDKRISTDDNVQIEEGSNLPVQMLFKKKRITSDIKKKQTLCLLK